ncbi:MAG: ABC transporter ATP-binding protein, partial [Candidatus Poribacteria bacterium]|nr:ABC transporter ATP-binding protein [Candidatus Poribacteria bacterium]
IMAHIKLENIVKRFGDVVAVKDFNLEIEDKEFVVFLGPSGCGKTTTLRLIAGLENPEEGDIFIDGQRVNDLSPADRDIAFVFQFYALYPHLSVYDNIAFPLKAVKVSKSEIDTQVKRVAEILQISNMLDRKPNVLSGGEMQRVALGRAMVRQPKVYLLDEPMANLDTKIRVDTRAEIKRLQHEIGATTIFVTHDQVEAMSLADRIAVIHQGLLQQIGTPHEVYNKPESLFVAGFMGMPTMNLLGAELASQEGESVLRLSHTDVHLRLSSERQARISSVSQENGLVFGIRPEHIRAANQPNGQGIPAHLHLVEPLGPVNILDIRLGTHPETQEPILLRVRTHPTFQVAVGDRVWLDFSEEEMHLFDRETEQAVWR